MGTHLSGIVTDIALTLAGAGAAKLIKVFSQTKTGAKLIKAFKALGYSDEVTQTGRIATKADDFIDEASDITRKAADELEEAFGDVNAIAEGTGKISTPYGDAIQEISDDAFKVKNYVEEGGTLYRGGKFGRSKTTDAQFWAPESPYTPGYSDKYGVDFDELDYIIGGKLKEGEPFITRPAPGLGGNTGGAVEVVTNPNAVKLDFFYMP